MQQLQQQCETQANNPPTTVGSTGTKELVVATNGTTGKLNRLTTVVQKLKPALDNDPTKNVTAESEDISKFSKHRRLPRLSGQHVSPSTI